MAILSNSVSIGRRRDINGQFLSSNADFQAVSNASKKRKARAARNQELGAKAFEELLEVVFLEGEGTEGRRRVDWISGEARKGPLADLVKLLFKASFRPSCKMRIKMCLLLYFQGNPRKKQGDLCLRTMRPYGSNNKDGVRIRVFIGRRLPKLTSAAIEMKRVSNWIEQWIGRGVLNVVTFNAAFDIFSQIFSSYKLENGQYRYIDYPVKPKSGSPSAGGNSATNSRDYSPPQMHAETLHEAQRPAQNILHPNTPLCQCQNNAISILNSGSSEAGHSIAPPADISELQWTPLEVKKREQCVRIFNTAEDSRLFYFACSAEDENGDADELGCYAPEMIRRSQNGEIEFTAVMADILHYSIDKRRTTPLTTEQIIRKARVSRNVQMLKKARRILGKMSYEDMVRNKTYGSSARRDDRIILRTS